MTILQLESGRKARAWRLSLDLDLDLLCRPRVPLLCAAESELAECRLGASLRHVGIRIRNTTRAEGSAGTPGGDVFSPTAPYLLAARMENALLVYRVALSGRYLPC